MGHKGCVLGGNNCFYIIEWVNKGYKEGWIELYEINY